MLRVALRDSFTVPGPLVLAFDTMVPINVISPTRLTLHPALLKQMSAIVPMTRYLFCELIHINAPLVLQRVKCEVAFGTRRSAFILLVAARSDDKRSVTVRQDAEAISIEFQATKRTPPEHAATGGGLANLISHQWSVFSRNGRLIAKRQQLETKSKTSHGFVYGD